MSTLLTIGNRLEDLHKLRSGDVLITPRLGDLKFGDFTRAAEGIAAGEAAARAKAEELKRFSVSEEEYAAFKARHHTRDPQETVVDRLTLENTSWVDDRIILRRLPDLTGRPLDKDAFPRDVMRLVGLDYFGVIRPEFRRKDQLGELTLHTPIKPYGRNSLQFGVSVQEDFEGQSAYTFALRHLCVAANRRGGEWENTGQIGNTLLLATQFYQPLDYSMRWFAAPAAFWRRENQTLWLDGEAAADFRVFARQAQLDFGRVFGDWSELRLGAFVRSERGEGQIGSSLIPDYEERDAGLQLSFRVDTLDASVFPTRGIEVQARATQSKQSFGADTQRLQNLAVGKMAFSFGRNTLVPGVEIGWTPEGPNNLGTQFRLGGLARLSGLHPDELLGDKFGLARLVYYRELTRLDLGVLSSRIYAGASLETGNAYLQAEVVTLPSLRRGGSLFVGAQTIIGPVFLGYGYTDGGNRLIYFNVGQRF